ncbi:MAG: T9SS type A sorting domain-containing protein [Ignavibacteriae bacterium]|nr:T9SS type A sorting domain-containing protein [Ignavibacteriota bacterium]
MPAKFVLSQNYPNPFNPVTKINFSIPKSELVTIKIYDILGKEVEVITNKVFSAGTYSIDYYGSKLSSGVYFYKLTSGDFSSTKKMMLIK